MDAEAELFARLCHGDEEALAELYERLHTKVFTLVFRLLGSHEEAEEVLQDTFYKLFAKSGNYHTWQRSPRAFIYTMARNEALSRLRKRKARPQKADAFDMHDPQLKFAAEPPATDATTRLWLERALSQLSDEERRLLECSYFEGYSHGDLAELVQMPLGTVKSKVRRALLKLRDLMEDSRAA